MLLIKVKLKPSKVDGLGVFADQKITKGTITWKFDPRFDLAFDPKEVEQMPEIQQELMYHYAFLSKVSGKYIYSVDDSRFNNHSVKNKNIDIVTMPGEPEICAIASRDIEIGEEHLEDYRELDANDRKSSESYLDN